MKKIIMISVILLMTTAVATCSMFSSHIKRTHPTPSLQTSEYELGPYVSISIGALLLGTLIIVYRLNRRGKRRSLKDTVNELFDEAAMYEN